MTNRVPAEHEESRYVAHKPCDSRLLTLPAAEVGTRGRTLNYRPPRGVGPTEG